MVPKKANRLATQASSFYRALPQFNDSQADSIDFAMLHALHEFMPEGSVTVVIEHGGEGLPLVLGATEDRLYAFDVPELPEENEPIAEVRWRSFWLDPEHCDIYAEVRYSRPAMAFGHEINRRSTWHVRVQDLHLEFASRVNAESETVEPRENFAQHLAGCLGVVPSKQLDDGGLREAA